MRRDVAYHRLANHVVEADEFHVGRLARGAGILRREAPGLEDELRAKIMYAAGRTASQQSGAPAQAQVPDAQVSVMNDDPFGLYTE